MVRELALPVRQACRAGGLTRSLFEAPTLLRDDQPVVAALEAYVRDNPRHSFDKLHPALRAPGFGKCRAYRVYKALGLNVKHRGKDTYGLHPVCKA